MIALIGGITVLLMFTIPLLFWLPPCKKNPSLLDSHILITGGSSGIGKAIAMEVARRGANVSLLARDKAKLEVAKKEVEKHKLHEKQKIGTCCADVTDKNQLGNVFLLAEQSIGFIDILINCAGMAKAELFEENHETFKQLMDLNYFGSVNATFLVIPKMKERRRGHIVFVSSMAGQLGVFGYTAYSASKYALRGLAESLLMEVRPCGVGVSISFPPDTDTPGFEEENKNKPDETRQISSSAGTVSPSVVARDIVTGIQSGKFLISCGMEGFLLSTLTCGASPASSRLELFTQSICMGIIRLVMVVLSFGHHKIAETGERKRRLVSEKMK